MSDLSGLSSIGGTLSALQDTGLREFIEANSGSWTGGVDYSAISGSIAPSGFAFFTAYSNLFADVSAAVAAGKICYVKGSQYSNIYLPLVYFTNGTDYYRHHLAVFGNFVCQTDAWSASGSNKPQCQFYSVNADLDPTTTHNGWHFGSNRFLDYDDLSGVMYKSAIGYDGDGKISGYNGSAFAGGAGGAEYSAGSNIDITDNVISGKDWTSEITAATEDMVTTGDLSNYVEYSAISGKLAPEDIVVFTYGKQSAAYPYILSAYAAGKLCYAKHEVGKYYYPLVSIQSANPNYGAYSGYNRAVFGKWEVGTSSQSVWSATFTTARMEIYFVDGASDKSGSDGWSYGWTQNTFYPQKMGDYYSASNPSGFITGVDLTPYQTTAGMTAYIPATVVATSADATGSNILYVVTGE
ncbi:MAG: hypothetical protein J6S85_11135 [Methanobrevibacter sp.]|nr:hypothetical protein [Methanobrevibacter sp.]